MPKVFWNGYYWLFWCPACLTNHWWDSRWSFNGDEESPTVTPSILVESTGCHLFLTDGRISYLSDCGHALAGKNIDCPEVDV